MKIPQFKSFERSSILLKFNIFFFLFAIIPLCVLMYLYHELKVEGQLSVSIEELNTALILVALGVISGYVAMRGLLKNLINVTHMNAERLRSYMSPGQIQELLKADEDEIAVLMRIFRDVTSRLEDNAHYLELTKKTLQSVMLRVGHGISHLHNIDTFLDLIVETTTEALSGCKGVLFLIDDDKKKFFLKTTYGMLGQKIEKTTILVEKSPFAPLLYARTALIIPKMPYSEDLIPDNEIHFDYPMICAPLLLKDKVLGVIAVSGRKMGSTFQEEEMAFLFNLATQTAVAIENAHLGTEASKTYFETLSALAMAVEAKDPYARGHSDRVAKISVSLALDLGLSSEEVNKLKDAAKIHDVGKIGVTDDVLSKPQPLTDQEWAMMKRHPEIGESIIRPIPSLKQLCDMVRHHHEKLDGSGYPDGLEGADISRSVRILTIADIYDALTTDRPYRKAMLHDEAMRTMRGMKEKIDQGMVDVLEKVV